MLPKVTEDMTVQQSDLYAGEPHSWVDDEIDLRRYLLVLASWWREILVITLSVTVLVASVIGIWQGLQPATYAASADVVIARVTSRIALDERITTSEETQQGGVASWRASLLQLAQSPAIAQAVYTELGGQLNDDWTAQTILNSVTIDNPPGSDPRTLSDIIRITARTRDPELSAAIANAWARYFVDHINQVYGQVPADTLAAVEAEVEAAQTTYLEAEAALEAYIAESQSERLQREISETVALRNQIQSGRDVLMAAGAISTHQVISRTIEMHLNRLAQLQAQRNQTQLQLNQARNLATQLEQSDPAASASNVLALQLLKAQVFAGPTVPGGQASAMELNVDLAPLTVDANALAADTRILVAILEGYLVQLDAEIAALSGTLANEPDFAFLGSSADPAAAEPAANSSSDEIQQTLLQLDQKIQNLRSQLAADLARQNQLTQQRDLAWTAYDTLSKKLIELNLTRTSANSEVRLGAAAVPPMQPEPQTSLLFPVVATAVASLVLAMMLAFIANALGRKPLLARS